MVNEIAVTRMDGAVKKTGAFLLRYGLVLVLGWIGAMKFTAYEAEGIKALVATSPLMSWMYKVFSLQATSNIIGVAEITAALLIAIRPISARLSAIGSVVAVSNYVRIATRRLVQIDPDINNDKRIYRNLDEWLSHPRGC